MSEATEWAKKIHKPKICYNNYFHQPVLWHINLTWLFTFTYTHIL